MSKRRIIGNLLISITLFHLGGCVTSSYRPTKIDSSEQSFRQREPVDLLQTITASRSNVFYTDQNITKADGAILSSDVDMPISDYKNLTLNSGTQLILIAFDNAPYYCTANQRTTIGTAEIFGCFLDEDQDGSFDSVHSFAGNPRRERGSRQVSMVRLQQTVKYERQQLSVDTGPNTWTLSYMGTAGDVAQIDHAISYGSGTGAVEWYRRSYFIPVNDIGKPWGGLSIPYIPFAGSWLPGDRRAIGALKIEPITATPTEMKLRIIQAWPEAQILKLPNVPGQYRTVPFRSKITPGN